MAKKKIEPKTKGVAKVPVVMQLENETGTGVKNDTV